MNGSLPLALCLTAALTGLTIVRRKRTRQDLS